jgi:7-cyano-7-deazaguanine reductase
MLLATALLLDELIEQLAEVLFGFVHSPEQQVERWCRRPVEFVPSLVYHMSIQRVVEDEMPRYSDKEAKAGLTEKLPGIEAFRNQFRDYEITVEVPEFTSVCPKTGLPDFGTIVIRYVPDKAVLELKSLKEYMLAYRNLGIFYENVVNRVLEDVVRACRPKAAEVRGEFNPRGGIRSIVEARFPRRTGARTSAARAGSMRAAPKPRRSR